MGGALAFLGPPAGTRYEKRLNTFLTVIKLDETNIFRSVDHIPAPLLVARMLTRDLCAVTNLIAIFSL